LTPLTDIPLPIDEILKQNNKPRNDPAQQIRLSLKIVFLQTELIINLVIRVKQQTEVSRSEVQVTVGDIKTEQVEVRTAQTAIKTDAAEEAAEEAAEDAEVGKVADASLH
jgi:hypothetical protein